MRNFSIKSYAKINIGLDVVQTREDGFHDLDMVMVPIQFHDSVLIREIKNKPDNYVTMDDYSLLVFKHNLATFAIDALAAKYKFQNKYRIMIHKIIPIKAGLGGGSSNAAATLNGINKILKLGATDEELIDIAKTIGADVPFFIKNKPMRCKGVGEKMEPIEIKNNYYCLIVKPKEGCSTKEVFTLSDSQERKHVNIDNIVKALAEGDDDLLAKELDNSLEEAATQIVPEIAIIKQELKDLGLKIVGMTGSGSTVFALSTDKKQLKKAAAVMEPHYFTELTKVLK